MRRRTLIVLGIAAALCLAVLIGIFAGADWDGFGQDIQTIWRNTLSSADGS